MYPHERSLVKKLAGKPFAIVGVNSDEDLGELAKRITEEKITWRSFWNGPDGIDGPISKVWNVDGWPSLFLLDTKGKIRFKNIRGKQLDDAIGLLLKEAEHSANLAADEDKDEPESNEVEVEAAGSDTTKYEAIKDYKAYIAGDSEVVVWYGKRVALVLDEEEHPEQRNPETMQRILHALDGIFDGYDRITGRRPKLTAPLKGKIRIEVSSKVGGGLAHHGRLGVAIGDGFFQGLYKRFDKGKKTVDQVFFYEIARNYWMSDMNPSIDYHTSKGPEDYGWWTVGFNNAMSIFLPAEVEQIDDMYYFGSNGSQFSKGMESNVGTYIDNPKKYNWDNSWNVPLVPWKERTSVNDLMTGLLIRLHREQGGIEFIQRLYAEIPQRTPLVKRSDRQGARDNFYESCCLAAKKDLHTFFTEELRWEISADRHHSVRKKLRPNNDRGDNSN